MQVVVSCPFFVVSEAFLGQGYLEVSSFACLSLVLLRGYCLLQRFPIEVGF